MSDRVTSERQSKAQKRAAAKAAALAAEEADRRRRQRWIVAGSALAVAAVLAGIVLLVQNVGDDSPAPALPPAPTSPPPPSFPPVPAGSDAALKQKPAVKAGTGAVAKLKTTELIKGTGPAVKAGQTITVNYVGVTYKDGKEFDSSWSRSEAAEFPIGVGRVIPGWDQGLVGVKIGSRVQLDIPPSLAYGEKPQNGAPAGALRFVVDILAAQ